MTKKCEGGKDNGEHVDKDIKFDVSSPDFVNPIGVLAMEDETTKATAK